MASSLIKPLRFLGGNIKNLLSDASSRSMSSQHKYNLKPKKSLEASRRTPCDEGNPNTKTILENPDPCKVHPSELQRFDLLHYRITDKTKHVYTPTWNEFPKQLIKQNAKANAKTSSSSWENTDEAPPQLRTNGERPKTARPPNKNEQREDDTTQQLMKMPSSQIVHFQSSEKNVKQTESIVEKMAAHQASYSERENTFSNSKYAQQPNCKYSQPSQQAYARKVTAPKASFSERKKYY